MKFMFWSGICTELQNYFATIHNSKYAVKRHRKEKGTCPTFYYFVFSITRTKSITKSVKRELSFIYPEKVNFSKRYSKIVFSYFYFNSDK